MMQKQKEEIPNVLSEDWGTLRSGELVRWQEEPHTQYGNAARVTVLVGYRLVFEASYVAAPYVAQLRGVLRNTWFRHCADCGHLVHVIGTLGERECGHV